ncbi:MAG: phosphatidate cytidylyltransferase [Acidobacteria bacterium]|nr:phosphatidate cytidylyltransferase [Acidobacteriota bacterium]
MTRLLSGVALAAAALGAILFLPFPVLRVIACLVAALGAHEYLGIVDPDRRRLEAVPILILVVLVCWSFSDPGGQGQPVALGALSLLVLGVAWAGFEVAWRRFAVARVRARLLAPLYLGMPLGMLAAIQQEGGRIATLLVIAGIVVSDSAQYYSGRRFGRRPLAPTISPKKTIEGAVGGLVVGTIFMVMAGGWVFQGAQPGALALLGAMIVVLGICGDLFESRLKRAAGVKDSSGLIPGHGGILDRIDALLFAVPAYYLYLVS